MGMQDAMGPSPQAMTQNAITFGLNVNTEYNNAYGQFSLADQGAINEDGTSPSPTLQAATFVLGYNAPIAGAGYRSQSSYYDPLSNTMVNQTPWQQAGNTGTALTQYSALGLMGTGLVGGAQGEGVIYLRTDMNGVVQPYIGQSQSMANFAQRVDVHAANFPNADFEYEIVQQGIAPGTPLDVAEETWIRNMGGPTNLSNPNGMLSNARYQMNDAAYQAAGGTAPLPQSQ
jgi:hypothetical protein